MENLKLRKEISKKFKCTLTRIICGAGSDEVNSDVMSAIFKTKR